MFELAKGPVVEHRPAFGAERDISITRYRRAPALPASLPRWRSRAESAYANTSSHTPLGALVPASIALGMQPEIIGRFDACCWAAWSAWAA